MTTLPLNFIHSLSLLLLPRIGATMAAAAAATRTTVAVSGAGMKDVNGVYDSVDAQALNLKRIPAGFIRTCEQMGWDSDAMWRDLYDSDTPYYLHRENDSYIYRNKGDGRWWIDGPSGAGVYIIQSREKLPPPKSWTALDRAHLPVPKVVVNSAPSRSPGRQNL